MIGLGLNATKTPTVNTNIVRDALVLRHDYKDRPVELVSSGAASFDGANDEVVIGDVIDFGTEDFSITAWIKILDTQSISGETFIASKVVDANNIIKLSFNYANDKFVMTAKADGNSIVGNSTSTALTSSLKGQWNHIAFTCDRDGKSSVYINGSTDTYGASVNSLNSSQNLDNAGGWAIGGRADSTASNFEGYICNAGIWKGEALTQPQIKSIMHKDYAALSASEKTNLVSWWNLDSVIDSADTQVGNTAVYDNHHGDGDILGSELVVGDWSEQNGWTNITGGIRQEGSNGATLIYSEMTDFVGSVFKISYTLSNVTDTSNLWWKFGGGNNVEINGTEGDHVHYLVSDATGDNFQIRTNASWAGDVTNMSLKLVKGNTGILA